MQTLLGATDRCAQIEMSLVFSPHPQIIQPIAHSGTFLLPASVPEVSTNPPRRSLRLMHGRDAQPANHVARRELDAAARELIDQCVPRLLFVALLSDGFRRGDLFFGQVPLVPLPVQPYSLSPNLITVGFNPRNVDRRPDGHGPEP